MTYPPLCMATAFGLAASLFSALACAAPSAPFVPSADDQIVQRLPLALGGKARVKASGAAASPPSAGHVRLASGSVAADPIAAEPKAERRLYAALSQAPNNLPLALATAQEALRRARGTGDPRAVGQAQAALAPWWSQATPPDAVRLLRATILQSQHHFVQALQDLDALIARPARATPIHLLQQARLTRAAVLQVQARLEEAALDCAALAPPATAGGKVAALIEPATPVATLAAACQAELHSLRGAPQRAARELAQLEPGAGPHRAWIALLRAELALRMGDAAAAQRHFKAAVAEGDPYAQAAYADAELEAGRPARALRAVGWFGADAQSAADTPGAAHGTAAAASANVENTNPADAALLRQAIALKRLQHPGAAAAAQAMRERLQDARTRGVALHQREEARFALDVEDQAARAWQLARANWQTQKEPADALLYVRAAMAAGASEEAKRLTQELKAQGWHDLRLDRAIASAQGIQP